MKTFTTTEIKNLKIHDTNNELVRLQKDLALMKEHKIQGVELKEMEIEICKNTLTFLNTL